MKRRKRINKKICTSFIITGMFLSNMMVVNGLDTDVKMSKVDNVYVYDQSSLMDEYTESVVTKPTYIIYPDQEVNELEADQLLDELGMKEHLKICNKCVYC